MTKFQHFKSKKKPWSMPALPLNTPSLTTSSSDTTLGQRTAVKEEEEETTEGPDTNRTSKTDRKVSTFKYRSQATAVSRSFRGHERRRTSPQDADLANRRLLDGEIESGYSSDRPRRLSPSEDCTSSTCESSSVGEVKVEPGKECLEERESKPRTPSTKAPPTKTHPYSRRIEITPRTASPSTKRARPRLLSHGITENDSSAASPPSPRINPTILKRRSTMSSIPSSRRLLPAIPVRRNVQPRTSSGVIQGLSPLAGRNSIYEIQDSETDATDLRGVDVAVDGSPDSKLVNSMQDVRTCSQDGGGGDSDKSGRAGSRTNPTPTGSVTSINSKDDRPPTPKVKHTVQYKNSSDSGKY